MFNSTVQGAAGWILPRYFDYDIVNGRAGTSVEWIRIYVPGQWHPVAPDTLGPAPDDSTTYREWRKVHHFEVYWPRESTGGTTTGTVLQPVSYATFYTWYYRDWVTRGYQRLGRPHPSIARPVFASGAPDLMYAGMTSRHHLIRLIADPRPRLPGELDYDVGAAQCYKSGLLHYDC